MSNETMNLLDFASVWRDKHLEKPEQYPLEHGEMFWLRQYLAYTARRIEIVQNELAEEASKRRAVVITQTNNDNEKEENVTDTGTGTN